MTSALFGIDALWILENISYLTIILGVVSAYMMYRRYLELRRERDLDLADEVAAHEKRAQGIGLREAA